MSGAALERLNSLSDAHLRDELRRCFDSEVWAAEVARQRPFADLGALLAAANSAWTVMDEGEWAKAFEALAERSVPPGDADTRAGAAVALDLYRSRFGYIFVTDAEHATADELLMLIRIRLGHEKAAEARRSREEYRNLVRRRLERWLDPDAG
ncbi:hypothetical protein BH23GEM9_BH23GEM9_06880 [soil metagenome]